MNQDNNVVVRWVWQDVQTLRPTWSQEKCQNTLDMMVSQLEERSIEFGWTVMEHCLDEE